MNQKQAGGPVEVAAGLVFRRGKLLITQRREADHLGGFWEFPGGKRESGEGYESCLRRELQEELGIVVQPAELIQSVTHSYPDKTVHLKFFRCHLIEHEPRPLACAAVAWVSLEEIGQYDFPAADALLLERLKHSPALWK